MNKNKLLKPFVLRSWRNILSLMGLFLGFSNAVTAQYGIVENHYLIQGQLITEDCQESLSGIKLRIQTTPEKSNLSYFYNETASGDQGRFSFQLYGRNYFPEQYYLFAEDTDGQKNGLFRDTVFVIPTASLNFSRGGEGHWQVDYINSDSLVLAMQRKGESPCRQIVFEPDTSDSDTASGMPPLIPEAVEDSAMLPITANLQEENIPLSSLINETAAPFSLNVYPNPNHGPFTLEMITVKETEVLIEIYDDRMRKIMGKTIILQSGVNTEPFDLSSVAPGTYFLSIKSNTYSKTIKLLRAGNR